MRFNVASWVSNLNPTRVQGTLIMMKWTEVGKWPLPDLVFVLLGLFFGFVFIFVCVALLLVDLY